jgi:hypothetical protein
MKMSKQLWAFKNEDEDTNFWPDTKYGLMSADVKSAADARTLLGLTADEARQLERDGELYKDINGIPYAIGYG